MSRIEVTVTYDQNTRALTIPGDKITISYKPRDWVVWRFLNIPPDSFGYLGFDNAPALGPFHILRSDSHAVLVGKGNTGAAAGTTFGYKAMLLDRPVAPPEEPSGVLATSPDAFVIQESAVRDSTPDITVIYKEGEALEVVPSEIGLNPGDTATWHFREFPPGYFATLQFDPAQGNPFSHFYVTAPLPDQPDGTFRAHGIGFASAGVPAVGASLNYHVQVRKPDGTIASDKDPVIDNLGPPIPD